jgi:3-hydroxyacyl-CoA dehydrogenase
LENIKEIGIIGSGKMGTDIFNYLSEFDLKINWVCSRSTDPDELSAKFKKKLNRYLKNGIINDDFFDNKLDGINISNDLNVLKNCDLLIECITEDLDKKKELFMLLDETVNKECIFTSNTSSFNPSLFFPFLKRKDKFVCLHFFYPIKLKDIVELVCSIEVSHHTTMLINNFMKYAKKTVLIQDEENSFILNRIFLEIQVEVYDFFLHSDKTVKELDDIVKNISLDRQDESRVKENGFSSFGAFELMDNVGIKTILNSIKEYVKNYDNKERYFSLIQCLENFVEQEFKEEIKILSDESIKNDIKNIFYRQVTDCYKKYHYEKSELDYALKQFLGTDFEFNL